MAKSESALIDLHFNKSYHFPLTDTPPLSIQLLATELNDMDNWYQLGTVLGVPPNRLDGIRKSSPVGGTGEWRIAMLQDWMNSKPDASWVDVIEAVKSLRYIKLAANLKSKYVPKTTESSHDAGICMCTIRLLCFNYLVRCTCIMFIILFTHLFFYLVPTKVSEVHASGPVVDCVLRMRKCFSQMLTNMWQPHLSAKVDIIKVRFFLESILESDEFSTCKGFEDVLRRLRKGYINAFNTSYLEQLADYLEIDEITQLISAYKGKRDAFFKDPIVTEFQDAVVNKVELSGGVEVVPEVRVPRSLFNKRTQRDMETLATLFCDSYQKPAVQMDDLHESKNVTSCWPVGIAVLLGIATLLLVVLAIKLNSLFEINTSLNLQLVELRAQLTQCQYEVKNLTEVKVSFLALKKESNISLAVEKRVDDVLDWLAKYKKETEEKLKNNNKSLKAEFHGLLSNLSQMIIDRDNDTYFLKYHTCNQLLEKCDDAAREHDDAAHKCNKAARERDQYSKELRKCEDREHSYMKKFEKLVSNNTQMIIEHVQYSFNYSACCDQLKRYAQLEHELRKNVSMLESENNKLTESYAHCSERLTTCEKCKLHSLYSRKCFQVMLGHVELICQPIFVI